MISVYLLNLIIYISLNPIKLAVYHIKIALSWLSPAWLYYFWQGPYSPNHGVFLFLRKGSDVAEEWTARRTQPCSAWCCSTSCWVAMEASCGPSGRDSTTWGSCTHSGTELSLKSARSFPVPVPKADHWPCLCMFSAEQFEIQNLSWSAVIREK